MKPQVVPAGARYRAALGRAAALLAALTACASPVSLEPARDAAEPGRAEIGVRLPSELSGGDGTGRRRRETDAQGTAAWGSPASVILRCGVDEPAPSTYCVDVSGVAWIRDDSDAPNYRFTTFGRTPATEVIVDGDVVSGSTVLLDLGPAIAALPASATRRCAGLADR